MTIRQYKKKYFICKDSNGKNLYVRDIVSLNISHETSTRYESMIYWNMLDGAFVDSHPAHIKIESSKYRNLRDYITGYNGTCYKVKSFNKI